MHSRLQSPHLSLFRICCAPQAYLQAAGSSRAAHGDEQGQDPLSWTHMALAQGVESTGHHSVRRHNEPLILGGIMCSAHTRLHRPSFSKHMYWACSGKMKHLHSFIIVFFWVLHEADSENRIAVSIVNLGGR